MKVYSKFQVPPTLSLCYNNGDNNNDKWNEVNMDKHIPYQLLCQKKNVSSR